MRRPLLMVALWLLAMCLLAPYALSATLQVAPVTLELESNQRASALYLTNTGDTPIHAQIRVYDWAQVNGKDVLTPTDDVVSSPAMTALQPGQQQLVRVIVLQPGMRQQEQSYRLIVDELPASDGPAHSRNAVHFLLRYSLPVFIAGAQPAQDSDAALSCTSAEIGSGVWCENRGASHIRLSNLQALTADGQVIESRKGLAGYVLPGQKTLLTLKATRHPLSALRVYLNENTHASQLPLRAPAARAASLATADASRSR